MTRRRFYAPPQAFASDAKSVTLSAEETRHLRDVLRLKSGDEVYVFDGAGREVRGLVQSVTRDSTEISVGDEVEPARPESPLNLTLAVALLKGEKFDLVVQKMTELGACEVVPVITRFADIRLRDESDANKRIARWQRIAIEAAKQSGRAVVPRLSTPVLLESLLTVPANSESLRLMFSERGGKSFAEVPQTFSDSGTITALVGSEGGWSDEEIQEARAAGWHVVTLGGRTLRAETAAITVAGLLQHKYGDLK